MGFLGDIGHFIMTPLYYAISAVLVAWHWLFSSVLQMDPDGGGTWVLSIIGLTLTVRAALIPLFVKQIKSSRNMQLIQPKVKELQKKYGHDRERLAQETMKLYKDSGTNPFASCLPILIQMPIFLALFRLLDHHAANGDGIAFLSDKLAASFGNSELFGAIPLKATFLQSEGSAAVQVVAAVLVVAMTATTFTTQRQLMSKNMPPDALSGPYAQQQKLLLYVLPVVFAVGGIAFPVGVLFYWTTSNLWTMGQQFYVIRNNPAPGTAAAKAKAERDRAKAARHGHGHGHGAVETAATPEVAETEQRPATRQQPKRQSREQRKKTAGAPPAKSPQSKPGTKPQKQQQKQKKAQPKPAAKPKPSPEGEQQ
ncbi:membrane protein insertase YidC [Nocardioides sp.]|uniref:membrane protein insertase YidC n=1 Tax=Nocardioides sp. TaxID=35761 RepID=UPI002ED79008